jgi:hypothetical protein
MNRFSLHRWDRIRLFGPLVPLCLIAFVPGCDLTGTKIIRASGVVTRAGKPVPNLFLNFLPAEGRPSWGVTDEKGYFTLHYDKTRDGAVPGLHTVFVTFKPSDPRQDRFSDGSKIKMPDNLISILAKYGNQDTTPLSIEIKNDQQFIKIELD